MMPGRFQNVHEIPVNLLELHINVGCENHEALLIRPQVLEHRAESLFVIICSRWPNGTSRDTKAIALFLDSVDLVEMRLVVPVGVCCPKDATACQITAIA